MKDWTDAFKEKLFTDRRPLPEGEWEKLEGLISRKARARRLRRIAYYSFAATAAVCTAVVLLPVTDIPGEETISAENDFGGETAIVLSDAPDEVKSIPLSAPIAARLARTAVSAMETALGRESIDTEVSIYDEVASVTAVDTGAVAVSTVYPEKPPSTTEKEYDYPIWNDYKKSRNRWSVSLISDGVTSSSSNYSLFPSVSPGIAGTIPTETGYLKKYHHSPPLTLGLSIGYGINDRLSIVSGVDYAFCKSEVTSKIDDSIKDQKAHYLGIPLHLDWSPLKKERFSFYIGAGAEAWSCLHATVGGQTQKDHSVYLAAICLGGFKYEPVRNVGLFVQPQYSHTFLPERKDPGRYLHTAISDDPDLFTVKVGLSLVFE